jgi:cytochrome P450
MGLPVFGNLLSSMRDPLGFPLRNYRRYGPVLRVHLLSLRGVALYGAEANRYILVDAADNFVVEPLFDRVGARWLVGEGLLFIDDPAHRHDRRLILPAFHRRRLEEYQAVMREVTAATLDRWRPGAEIDIAREMRELALVVAGRALFNRDLGGAARELGEAVGVLVTTVSDALHVALSRLPFDVPGLGTGGSVRRALARIDAALGAIIAEHEQAADSGDVVSMLVAARDEDGGKLSRRQIRDHLLTLFVAGHETSANALTWAFYLLAQHPAVAAKLQAELDRELGDRAPTAADMDRLPYLEQVVKETLRLYPPAASAVRVAKAGFDWRGFHIPAGSVVFYSPYISHRMPGPFPDADIFRPERFDPALGPVPPQYAYVPFGGGARSCVGAPFAMLEIRTVLAMTLQRYRLAVVPGQRVEMTRRTTLQPRYGIRLRVHPQDGAHAASPARVRGDVIGATPGPP